MEGNVTCSGDTLRWLRDEAGLIDDILDVEEISLKLEDAGDVYLVPAFSGLGAPYNMPEARALICGLSRGSNKNHIIRAALESMAYQDADVIQAMLEDTKGILSELRVDGAPTVNKTLMQFLADILGCPVQCAAFSELSALGVGLMAAQKLALWDSSMALKKGDRYVPKLDKTWRKNKLNGWRTAVNRSVQQ
ncbi:MAG: hypothetical protein GYA87_05940 [Christensenellaceae bacterium]|nr:hypothetical protein [Christensenellaceae bacterium]